MERNSNTISLGLMGTVVILALALAFGSGFSNTAAQHTISASGTGEVLASPDELNLFIQVQTIKPTAKQAQDENAKTSNSVIDALKATGIKADDIETQSYTLYPKYEWDEKQSKSILTAYELDNSLKVKTTDTANAGKYIDAAITAGANNINSVQFGLSKEKEKQIKAQALTKAAVAAREKAQDTAGALGITLGKVMTVSESDGYQPPIYYASYAKADAAGQVPTISPQDVTVSVQVNVVYEIR